MLFFQTFYNKQLDFQKKVAAIYGYKNLKQEEKLPTDNVDVASYHMLALLEEAGELVKSDKRWKNFRNQHYDKKNKLEEVADCIITLFNICIFSGVSAEELESALFNKMQENDGRIVKKNDINYEVYKYGDNS